MHIKPMYYIYVGSAFGPGGVRARVNRHFSNKKSKHWHIDYLLEYVNPVCAWYSYESEKLEHKWAAIFTAMEGVIPVKGFGCSDCSCAAHLFETSSVPDYKKFADISGADIRIFKA
ncbi:MAG: GIY-YIG nuclease family protein [Spirochaetes bacterium]|nr:GIY-YIG nuclease family protein [Spirochaetota bacterium]